MDKTLLSLSRFFALIPLWILRARWPVLIILISSTVFMGYGAATRTTLDMTIDSFIDQDDPAIAALNEFREQFGSDDSVFLVYRALDGDVFSAQSLRAAQASVALNYTLSNHLALLTQVIATRADKDALAAFLDEDVRAGMTLTWSF